MQQIKAIVKGPYEPEDNQVLWIDTSNPDEITGKVFEGGGWKSAAGAVEGLSNLVNKYVVEVDSSLIGRPLSADELQKLDNTPIALFYNDRSYVKVSATDAQESFIRNEVKNKYSTTSVGLETLYALYISEDPGDGMEVLALCYTNLAGETVYLLHNIAF